MLSQIVDTDVARSNPFGPRFHSKDSWQPTLFPSATSQSTVATTTSNPFTLQNESDPSNGPTEDSFDYLPPSHDSTLLEFGPSQPTTRDNTTAFRGRDTRTTKKKGTGTRMESVASRSLFDSNAFAMGTGGLGGGGASRPSRPSALLSFESQPTSPRLHVPLAATERPSFFGSTTDPAPSSIPTPILSFASASSIPASSVPSSVPTSILSFSPTSVLSSAPASILSSAPASILSSAPASILSSAPTSILSSAPTSILSSAPSILSSLPSGAPFTASLLPPLHSRSSSSSPQSTVDLFVPSTLSLSASATIPSPQTSNPPPSYIKPTPPTVLPSKVPLTHVTASKPSPSSHQRPSSHPIGQQPPNFFAHTLPPAAEMVLPQRSAWWSGCIGGQRNDMSHSQRKLPRSKAASILYQRQRARQQQQQSFASVGQDSSESFVTGDDMVRCLVGQRRRRELHVVDDWMMETGLPEVGWSRTTSPISSLSSSPSSSPPSSSPSSSSSSSSSSPQTTSVTPLSLRGQMHRRSSARPATSGVTCFSTMPASNDAICDAV